MPNFTWSDYVLDNFVAPGFSDITECLAEEIDEDYDYMGSRFLNAIFIVRFEQKVEAFSIDYIRRVSQSVEQYNMGVSILKRLASEKNSRPMLYFNCLHCFESASAMLYQSMLISQAYLKSIDVNSDRLFKKDDGSREERLSIIYNDWKHSYDRIERGELPPRGILPVWLTKFGLKSNGSEISFSEIRELMLLSISNARYLAETVPNEISKRRDEKKIL